MTKSIWRTAYYPIGRGKGIVTTSQCTQEVGESYLCKAGLNWRDGGEAMTAASVHTHGAPLFQLPV